MKCNLFTVYKNYAFFFFEGGAKRLVWVVFSKLMLLEYKDSFTNELKCVLVLFPRKDRQCLSCMQSANECMRILLRSSEVIYCSVICCFVEQ